MAGDSSLAATTAWLVDIPSPTGSEDAIATEVSGRLERSVPVIRTSNSLVAGRRTGRPLFLVVGHLDTVPAQGQASASVRDGRMHGLGSTDMKGGLAVMIHLLEGIRPETHDLVGVFYEGEEGPASGNMLEPLLLEHPWLQEAEFAVVLEPCDREIQLGCNGAMNASVVFSGVAAHSARPWAGENAISKAGSFLAGMHGREPVPHVIGGLEYFEVMSVTRAEGGVANNVIPAEFRLNVNYRFTPDMTVEAAELRLREECATADRVEIVDAAPAGPAHADHPLVSALTLASGARLAPKQGWTDVARLGAYGIPAVNFGPGETALAHRQDESLALADLDLVYSALAAVLS